LKDELPVRKSIRLKDYDYSSAGYYFLTMCVQNGHEMLGQIVGRGDPDAPSVQLSEYGMIAQKYIEQIERHYNDVMVDKYVIMTNHIHMIIIINKTSGAQSQNNANGTDDASGSPRPTDALIPNIMKAFKRLTNKEFGFDMWQTSYNDRIIRDKAEYQNKLKYIDENPAKWAEDDYFVEK